MRLDEVDSLTDKIEALTARIDELIAQIPEAAAPVADDTAGGRRRPGSAAAVGRRPPRRDRRDRSARRPGHHRRGWFGHGPVPDCRPSRVLGQAGAPHHPVRTEEPIRQDREGQPLSQGCAGEAAIGAAKTDTFLGERYRRLVRRRGKQKASSPSPGPSWSSPGTSLRTPTPASTISDPTSTTITSTRTARPETSSTSFRYSATKSPSRPPPDQNSNVGTAFRIESGLHPDSTSIPRAKVLATRSSYFRISFCGLGAAVAHA